MNTCRFTLLKDCGHIWPLIVAFVIISQKCLQCIFGASTHVLVSLRSDHSGLMKIPRLKCVRGGLATLGQRESEKTGTGEWYDTKCSIERYEKSIFSPALRTSSGLFFSSQCSLQMRGPHVALLNLAVSVELTLPRQLFFLPPPHKPRRSTLTDRDTLWQQSTSGRICKAHRVVCMSKKKKSLCLFHEDA